ncbi:MAG: TetR/AcrR family transcriptional regulator [Roseiflexaceae bacterium]
MAEQTQKRPPDHRGRLMRGMAAALAEKGYSETTIADIVRHAGVSKRTFYEHFASKEACLLALYVASSERIFQAMAAALEDAPDLPSKLERAMVAYFAPIQGNPAVARTLFIEILAAGLPGWRVRRAVNERFAGLLQALAEAERLSNPAIRPLDQVTALALVGGITELVLHAIETDRLEQIDQQIPAVTGLIQAVMVP